jgi:trypsin-like peptidase
VLATDQFFDGTFKLKIGNQAGTGFILARHGRRWLVTAEHVASAAANPSNIGIEGHTGSIRGGLTEVARSPRGADIAVYLLDSDIGQSVGELDPATTEPVPSQETFFLGYPFEFDQPTHRPFVKRAAVSGTVTTPSGAKVWLLDGMSNPGFSGGPVACYEPLLNRWAVLAIVHGFWRHPLPIQIPDGPLQFLRGVGSVGSNPGLFLAWDIGPALEAIDHWLLAGGSLPTGSHAAV